MKIPSEAQAKRIAHHWTSWHKFTVVNYADPTSLCLVRNGWAVPTGSQVRLPSGAGAEEYEISRAGFLALAAYLIKRFG